MCDKLRKSFGEESDLVMQKLMLSKTDAEDYLNGTGELCKAMFIEGARVLGFSLEAPIPREAQERILLAAGLIANGLAALLDDAGDSEPEGDLYH